MEYNLKEETENDSRGEIYWLYVFIFILGSMAIAGICYLMCGNNFYSFKVGNEPEFALDFKILMWSTMFGLDLIGLASYFMWLSRFTDNRPKKEILENFIPLIIHLVLFILWPLFTFGLNLPIVGCAILGASIIVAIYLVYRYFNSSIIAGILFSIWTLWLMYMLSTNIAFCLIK